MDLSTAIYKATRSFPKEEMFGLTNQLRRASVSIPSNIAEGKGRLTAGEFIQFLGIARGSAQEIQTQIDLAMRLAFGIEAEMEQARDLSVEVLKILNASLNTLQLRIAAKRKRA